MKILKISKFQIMGSKDLKKSLFKAKFLNLELLIAY